MIRRAKLTYRRSSARPGTGARAAVLLAATTIALGAAFGLARADGSASVERGRSIYRGGGAGIVAVLSGAEVSSGVLPCSGCHGRDGRGRPEGGVKPSSLVWEDLVVDRRRAREGRRHQGYNEKQLARAIAMGVDPAGNPLQPAMPRYRMSARDMADLIAYLKVIGSEHDMGLTDSTIETGTLLGYRSDDAAGAAMRQTIGAYFDEVNARGGVYGRRIRLDAPTAADTTPERLRAFLDRSAPFALVGSIGAGEAEDPSSAAAASRTPLIGAVSAAPRSAIGQEIFYLFPGLAGESGALMRYAARRLDAGHRRGAILYGGTPAGQALAAELADSGAALGWSDLRAVAIPADPRGRRSAIDELKREDRGLILSLLPPESDLVGTLSAAGWAPSVLVPSSLWPVDPASIPGTFEGRIFLSYPLWHASAAGAREYEALRRKHGLGDAFRSYRLAALAGARIYVEALMRSGRNLSREALVSQVRRLYEFDTGLIPPVTYGPNRSIGSTAVYIARVDLGRRTMELVTD